MRSTRTPRRLPRLALRPLPLALATLALVGPAYGQQQSASTPVGNIDVQGAPGGTDTGLIQQEDAVKERSSISRNYIDKHAPTANPFQLLNLLPGVNAYSYDATGLYGGGLRVRGLNSDQLGFTVDGAPVNDSGNFAVYPQEYTDSECIDNIFVTQGSTDTEAPHIGASGGNIGINSATPLDAPTLRVSQTGGSYSLYRTAGRYDTGRVLGDSSKFLVCLSKARADKFKGPGRADREHVDFKGEVDFGKGNRIVGGVLYNDAVNSNIRALTKAQISLYGYNYDFGNVAPVTGTANDATNAFNVANNITGSSGSISNNAPGSNLGYAGFNLNPFRNAIVTANGLFNLAPNLTLTVEPYYWYGYGTGGNELKLLTEGFSGVHGGVSNIYHFGNSNSKVFVYNGSVTDTDRPGAWAKFDLQLADQHVTAGAWYERAHHKQTGPYAPIVNGQTDIWLASPASWALYNDGTPVESRNYITVSTGDSVFASDSITLDGGRLNVVVGASDRQIKRDFTNYPSSLSGGAAYYQMSRTYQAFLPNLGAKFQLTPEQQLFADVAKNMKAPANFVLSGLWITPPGVPATFVNGVQTNGFLRAPTVDKETSTDLDLGWRYQTTRVTASATAFLIDFHDRIATSYDPSTALSTDQNVGRSRTTGLELEGAATLAHDWSLYASATWTQSRIRDDKVTVFANDNVTPVTLPTSGKKFPDTPNLMVGADLQYATANWFGSLEAKYTGKRYTTLINDDSVGGYTAVNASAGYTFESSRYFKKPTVQVNLFNLFSTRYLNLNSGSGSSFTNNAANYVAPNGKTVNANLPQLYVSEPLAVSITVRSEF